MLVRSESWTAGINVDLDTKAYLRMLTIVNAICIEQFAEDILMGSEHCDTWIYAPLDLFGISVPPM